MKKVTRHFSIPEELHKKVLLYMKESKNNYSEEICLMIEEAISNRLSCELLNSMNNDIKYILKKVNLSYELIKQLYSDLDLTNITDPKKSYAVNEFLRKVKVSKLDD